MSTFDDRFALQTVSHDLVLFGDSITYRPLNVGASDKTIKCILLKETRNAVFNTGTAAIDYETMQVYISSRYNSEGHISPTEWSRAGQTGDTLVINGETWYLREVLEKNVAGLHKLLLSNNLTSDVGQG